MGLLQQQHVCRNGVRNARDCCHEKYSRTKFDKQAQHDRALVGANAVFRNCPNLWSSNNTTKLVLKNLYRTNHTVRYRNGRTQKPKRTQTNGVENLVPPSHLLLKAGRPWEPLAHRTGGGSHTLLVRYKQGLRV